MTAKSGDQAVKNGRQVTRYDQGYCQRFVRDPCWQVPSLYGSAIDAWNGARHKHPGDRTPPKGAPCYYAGGSYGHAVISVGGGRIRSTDCTSATYVNDTDLAWPERAWGYRYLGWTEDLNGVDLPIGGGEDEMPLSDQDVQRIAKAVWNHTVPVYDKDSDEDRKAAQQVLGQTHNRAGQARDAARRAAKE